MKLFYSILCFVLLQYSYTQESYSAYFLTQYTALDTTISVDEYNKLVEKNKLNESIVTEIYAQSFNYNDVEKELRVILLAYAIQFQEKNHFYFYKQSENLLQEKSYEMYMLQWEEFCKDKTINDELLIQFINEEWNRLKLLGINTEELAELIP